ncbi:MAG: neutral zinc metallopeptidase [Mailhella sp.]|nr:neutral zinc metallopeptidase [Mailhella sp.]
MDASRNVEDRRGMSGPRRGMALKGGAGTLVLLIVMVAGYYGIDLTPMLSGVGADAPVSASSASAPSAQEQELARFSSVALKTTEDTWGGAFRNAGLDYKPARMVLFTGATDTACGYGQSAMGPFYCPADETLYLDLAFYNDM